MIKKIQLALLPIALSLLMACALGSGQIRVDDTSFVSRNLSSRRLTKRMPGLNAPLRQAVGKASKHIKSNDKLGGDAIGAAIQAGYSSSKAGSSLREGRVEKSDSGVAAGDYWRENTFLGTDDARPTSLPPIDGKPNA